MANREDDFVARVGRRLNALRVDRCLTQQQVADRLEVALKNLQRIEAGRQNLTLRTIFRVARALGVAPEAAVVGDAHGDFLKVEPGAIKSSSPLAPRPVPVFRIQAAAGFAREGQLAEVVGWAILPQAVDEIAAWTLTGMGAAALATAGAMFLLGAPGHPTITFAAPAAAE
ncbi:MAG: hypothetical protein A2138_12205 [Deltaproteobacteria bacterium RBG_16_71_12]|nr:MAG: hypothetical protein A2138_12205 [Deltaproteobacteria bacterium RBG_16_71_12]